VSEFQKEKSMTELAHVVFYVRDLQRSLVFYRDVVGFEVAGTIFNGRAALLSGGSTHHELLLIEVGEAPGPLRGRRIGLYHVAFKVGEDLDALRRARERIQTKGFELAGQSDHTVSQSLYLNDPDGNEVELFVDDPSVDRRSDKSWMEAPVKPLEL
jgi:catechol 2,3-dioxygenase